MLGVLFITHCPRIKKLPIYYVLLKFYAHPGHTNTFSHYFTSLFVQIIVVLEDPIIAKSCAVSNDHKCFNSTEVLLPALLVNYDLPIDQQTDRRDHREDALPITEKSVFCSMATYCILNF